MKILSPGNRAGREFSRSDQTVAQIVSPRRRHFPQGIRFPLSQTHGGSQL